MAMMTLQQAFAWIHAREPRACLVGDGATPVARVHTDSRTLQVGDLFDISVGDDPLSLAGLVDD